MISKTGAARSAPVYFIYMEQSEQLMVTLQDVYDACEIVCSMPAPEGAMAKVRNEAVMDVYTVLEQLAMERAVDNQDG